MHLRAGRSRRRWRPGLRRKEAGRGRLEQPARAGDDDRQSHDPDGGDADEPLDDRRIAVAGEVDAPEDIPDGSAPGAVAGLEQDGAEGRRKVRALTAEMTIDTDTATANWRKSSPEMPGMKATGTKTERSTSVIAMIGAVISPMARRAASAAVMVGSFSRWCSTASTTTMASSTTMPIASTRARSDTVLAEKSASIAAKVPMSETGTAISGMRVADAAEEEIHDDDDEREGLEQGLDDLVDALLDEDRRVVGDLVFDTLWNDGLSFSRKLGSVPRWRWRCRRATGRRRSRRPGCRPAVRSAPRRAGRARPAPRRARARTNRPAGP